MLDLFTRVNNKRVVIVFFFMFDSVNKFHLLVDPVVFLGFIIIIS